MKKIMLTQGKVALVDDEDYEILNSVNWYAQRDNRTFYAERHPPRLGSRQKTERMHRLVLSWKIGRDIAPGMIPDHEDGNGLNNQRSNLSEKTYRGNTENRHIAKTSQYLGVSWCKNASKWRAQIRAAGKIVHLGFHTTEMAAAQAREVYTQAHPELGAGR